VREVWRRGVMGQLDDIFYLTPKIIMKIGYQFRYEREIRERRKARRKGCLV
jgi:hypothetical protein